MVICVHMSRRSLWAKTDLRFKAVGELMPRCSIMSYSVTILKGRIFMDDKAEQKKEIYERIKEVIRS